MSREGRWRIWYSGGDTFSNEDGPPEDAPRDGVQAIAEKRDGRTIVWTGSDLYCWAGEGWHGAPVRKTAWPANAPILTGTLIDPEAFQLIRAEAMLWVHAQAC